MKTLRNIVVLLSLSLLSNQILAQKNDCKSEINTNEQNKSHPKFIPSNLCGPENKQQAIEYIIKNLPYKPCKIVKLRLNELPEFCQLCIACITGNESAYVKHTEQADTNQIYHKCSGEIKYTLMHYACLSGNKNFVQKLITEYKQEEFLNKTNRGGDYPLFTAVSTGQLEVAKYLFENTIAKNYLVNKDKNPFPILYEAAQSGSEEVYNYFKSHKLTKNQSNHKDIGMTAAFQGSYDFVKKVSLDSCYKSSWEKKALSYLRHTKTLNNYPLAHDILTIILPKESPEWKEELTAYQDLLAFKNNPTYRINNESENEKQKNQPKKGITLCTKYIINELTPETTKKILALILCSKRKSTELPCELLELICDKIISIELLTTSYTLPLSDKDQIILNTLFNYNAPCDKKKQKYNPIIKSLGIILPIQKVAIALRNALDEYDQKFKNLLKSPHVNLNICNVVKNTLLHIAVYHNRAAHVQHLLEHGANPNAANKVKSTPLHFAVTTRNKEIANLLLKFDKVQHAYLYEDLRDGRGIEPWELAINLEIRSPNSDDAEKYLAIANHLRNHREAKKYVSNGVKASELLFKVCRINSLEVLEILEKNYPDVLDNITKQDINTKNFYGQTVLHRAIQENNFDMVKLLLERNTYPEQKQTQALNKITTNKIDVNAQDNNGRTALYYVFPSYRIYCCCNGNAKCAQAKILDLLIKNGLTINQGTLSRKDQMTFKNNVNQASLLGCKTYQTYRNSQKSCVIS